MSFKRATTSFEELLKIMERLRAECPWDREQDFESLRPLTIEESYELNEALLEGDNDAISKELGDLLLHIVFYSKVGEEDGFFDIGDVIEQLNEKLKYRHPHIFGGLDVESSEDVEKSWEMLKEREKDGNRTLLSGVPNSLPSLIKAYRMQDKARAVGFDWAEPHLVWEKVKEEIAEFEEHLSARGTAGDAAADAVDGELTAQLEEELGDLLFSLVNAARLYQLNPDNALENSNQKFIRRLAYVESKVKEGGGSWSDYNPEELEELWKEAKTLEER